MSPTQAARRPGRPMQATVLSSTLRGTDGLLVEVEVDLANYGFPRFSIVGLAEGAVRESKDRVRSALRNGGYKVSARRITVNLAPADVKKDGAAFDLPIDGRVKAVRGALPVAAAIRTSGLRGLLVPSENAREAAVIQGIEVIPV